MKQMYLFRAVPAGRWFAVFLLALAVSIQAQAQVSGVIFQDYNWDGVRSDTLPVEWGMADVTVRAFVDLSKTPVLTTTRTDGTYSFSSTEVPPGKLVRIEFGDIPVGTYNGPYGSASQTSVQFATAPATHIDIGVIYPSDYCQPKGIQLITPCYINGNTQLTLDADGNTVPDERQAARTDVLVGIAYEASGVNSPTNFPPVHYATAGQVGAIWSLAYQRRNKTLFSAAVVKRHMSFGPLGSGGIYATDIATRTTTSFVNVRDIGIETGDMGDRGLFADKTQANADPKAMTAVGRMSIGGMEMGEDDKTLYLINLNDRRLYSVFLDAPARVPTAADVKSWAIPSPGCSNGDFRPWAVKMYRGKLYIGVVCSAETSQKQSDLSATIYRFDPSAATPTFENVLSFPLDFRRGPADLTDDPAHPERGCSQYDHWLPWTDAWPTPCGLGDNPTFVMYPQPMVVDLEFYDDGSMLIGFLDRFGHLAGVANQDPNGNGLYDGFTGGDLLRAYKNKGVYELEQNGKAGNRTGSGVGNNEGPGGGEFYGKDNWFFIDHIAHAEVTNGALSMIPGYQEVVSSAFDPIENVFKSGGLKVFNNANGQVNRNYVLYTNEPGSFGKASGLGDNKVLCDLPPIEIGNRIWFDDNRDGIQDAYEPGIDGVTVTLHDMGDGGNLVATQMTHDGGQFYFNTNNVVGGLKFDQSYEIRMDTAQLALLDITLKGAKPLGAGAGGRLAARSAGGRVAANPQRHYSLSPANRTSLGDPELRDSDGQLVGGSAVIAVTTQSSGQNNFTLDMSVYSCPELANEKDTVRLCANASLDSIAAVGKYLSRVDSVQFVVFSSPQSGTAMYGPGGTVLGTVLPDAGTLRAVLKNPILMTTNNVSKPARQYIYAIIYPTPENPACRQSGETVVQLSPSLKARATGASLACSTTAVTLKGEALYGDDTPSNSATFAWSGPGGYSSTEQNPTVSATGVYTLTVGDGTCPASAATATASVVSDTSVPALTASVTAKTCLTCKATMIAEAPGATFSWVGPNNFTATGASAASVEDGTYTVTATGGNGCFVAARLLVVPFDCPPPGCAPIEIIRVR